MEPLSSCPDHTVSTVAWFACPPSARVACAPQWAAVTCCRGSAQGSSCINNSCFLQFAGAPTGILESQRLYMAPVGAPEEAAPSLPRLLVLI